MFRVMILGVMAACLTVSFSYADKLTEDFEGDTKKWEMEGAAKAVTEQFHGGAKSLQVLSKGKATWVFSKEDKFGKFVIWVYDSKVGKVKKDKNPNGPSFGIQNADGEQFKMGLVGRPSGNNYGSYYWNSTPENGYRSWWSFDKSQFIGGKVKQGWHKFTFNRPDAKKLTVDIDDAGEIEVDVEKAVWTTGFSAVFAAGGNGLGGEAETFCFDDIEIEQK